MKLGIIGCGYVGKAVRNAFAPYHEMRCYDVVPERSTHSIDEVRECDVIFVCVPTPSAPDGSCNITAVQDALRSVAGVKCPVLLKSTVPPGTCDELARKYDIECLLHNPEFLSARTANEDYLSPSRHIIGIPATGEWMSYIATQMASKAGDLFKARFPGVPVVFMDRKNSELCKYICNCYGATVVSFFNEMHAIAGKLGCDWTETMRGVMSWGNVPHVYANVPGHDSQLGWGGACWPKDTSALIKIAESVGERPFVLKGAVVRNDIQRGRA